MTVTITNLDMTQETFLFAPDNYAKVIKFYSDLVQNGEIYTYTAKM